MKIWLLKEDVDKYNSFDGYEVKQTMDVSFFGSSLKDKWVPPTLKAYYKKRKVVDISGFTSGAPLFSYKAIESLQEFLSGKAELLEAYFDNIKYYVINV